VRFGLEDGSQHTLEEVGQSFAVTREPIRQIEAKAAAEAAAPVQVAQAAGVFGWGKRLARFNRSIEGCVKARPFSLFSNALAGIPTDSASRDLLSAFGDHPPRSPTPRYARPVCDECLLSLFTRSSKLTDPDNNR
jgi:hypothetical protein